ncbi:APC family permease [Piscirickettsia salmonis]|uniref:APC family permease n=1 Tax=Piscirickettsia salmonis TaxID=1238 RepID=UPI0012BA9CA6|nr:APC family permease [Piscirickettsia salmonis]QGP60105.1 L-aspartate transporter [Piscirickettsia salmonis]
MKHKIGLISATFAGVASIIGSGWLFAAYYTAKAAGPASILAWVITAIIILVLGVALAEIAAQYPKRGLLTRAVTISHGKDSGFIFALANWLGIVAVIPTEAEGSVQYIANLSPALMSMLFNTQTSQLTVVGLLATSVLIMFYFILNWWGIKLLVRANNLITVFKLIIPAVSAIAILLAAFHSSNFTSYQHSFMPYGISSVFTVIISAGIIYSFNGFQTIVAFSSEIKNPKRNIPLAIILAISICLLLYILLQVSFLGAIDPNAVAKGWHTLNFHSPLVQLTTLLGLNLVSIVLYIDAFVSPSGTGLAYTGSTGRMLCAMAQEGQAPKFFAKLHPLYNFSRRALIFNIIIAISILAVFRSWAALVTALSLFHIISYMAIPLTLKKLRATLKPDEKAFRLPFAKLFNPLLFIGISFLFIFSQYPTTLEITILTTIFYLSYLIFTSKGISEISQRFKSSCWFWLYMLVLSLISILSPPHYGGNGFLQGYNFYFSVVIVSLIMYYLSSRLGDKKVQELSSSVSEVHTESHG